MRNRDFREFHVQANLPSRIRLVRVLIRRVISPTSAKHNSVPAEWLSQSGRAPSEPSETPRWQITPRPAAIQRIVLHITLQSQFHCFFSLCRYSIVNKHYGGVANCDHSTRHFVYHICLCYSHKIRYLIIWHEFFKYLYIYTYGQSGHRW